jgi:hypothetical protein
MRLRARSRSAPGFHSAAGANLHRFVHTSRSGHASPPPGTIWESTRQNADRRVPYPAVAPHMGEKSTLAAPADAYHDVVGIS